MASTWVEAFPCFEDHHFEPAGSNQPNAADQKTTKKCAESEQESIARPDAPKRETQVKDDLFPEQQDIILPIAPLQHSTERNDLQIDEKAILDPESPDIESVKNFDVDVERGSIELVTRLTRWRKTLDPVLMWIPGTDEWNNPRHLIDGKHPDRIHGRRPNHEIFPDNFPPLTSRNTRKHLWRCPRYNVYGIALFVAIIVVILVACRKR